MKLSVYNYGQDVLTRFLLSLWMEYDVMIGVEGMGPLAGGSTGVFLDGLHSMESSSSVPESKSMFSSRSTAFGHTSNILSSHCP